MPRRKKRKRDDATLERVVFEADASTVELTLRLRITSAHALLVTVKDGKVRAAHEIDTRIINAEKKR